MQIPMQFFFLQMHTPLHGHVGVGEDEDVDVVLVFPSVYFCGVKLSGTTNLLS